MDVKKWMKFFSPKKTKRPKPAKRQKSLQESFKPLSVIELGESGCPSFDPQPLLHFYAIFAITRENKPYFSGDTSMIKLINLKHPENNNFCDTVFALKAEEGWIFTPVGEKKVYQTDEKAFIFEETEKFEVSLFKRASKNLVKALCTYKEGEVSVYGLEEKEAKTEKRTRLLFSIGKSSLKKAFDYAKKHYA